MIFLRVHIVWLFGASCLSKGSRIQMHPRLSNLLVMATLEVYDPIVGQRWKQLCRHLHRQARQAVVLLHRAS